MEKNSYLPIGTICEIKNFNNRVMIIGYNYSNDNQYDYICTIYPVGLASRQSILFFHNKDIKKILYLGYKNDIYEKYTSILRKIETNDLTNEEKEIINKSKEMIKNE